MTARHTISEFGRKEDGVLEEPAGLPELREGDALPADLRAFYWVCGGLTLQKIRMRVVEPSRLVPLDSGSRYLLAERYDGEGERVAIDLSADGRGRCYEVSERGDCVAPSFTSFLARLSRDGIYWRS
jgi:antitoxin YokJ